MLYVSKVVLQKGDNMKVGEIYKNRFNKYFAKVTNVSLSDVTLETLSSGVKEKIDIRYFNTNWNKVSEICNYQSIIKKLFKGWYILYSDSEITVSSNDDFITFSISDGELDITLSDSLYDIIIEHDIDYTAIENAIKEIAGLLTD